MMNSRLSITVKTASEFGYLKKEKIEIDFWMKLLECLRMIGKAITKLSTINSFIEEFIIFD